jgi:hypothetical protein
MSPCGVDDASSPTFRSQSSRFLKKHKKLKSDLNDAMSDISKDYKNACDAARVPNRKFDPVVKEVWKYSIKSTDLRRSHKNAFRAIGVFLDEEQRGQLRTLYLVLFYFKGDKADFDKEELEQAVKFLRGQLASAATTAGNEEEPKPET